MVILDSGLLFWATLYIIWYTVQLFECFLLCIFVVFVFMKIK